MSAQFGQWNFDRRPVDRDDLEKADSSIALYGPDGRGVYLMNNVGICHRAFFTTKESRLETQPHVGAHGVVTTWDGRLDNRSELISELRGDVEASATDVAIVAAAYERWGSECLPKFIGDWAVSIWDERSQSLVLAKDPVGTRHLYYALEKDHVTWCTVLDPLVLLAKRRFMLCEEYIAGWLSFFPAAHLTPYTGILAVPPSSFIVVCAPTCTIGKYWDFKPQRRIRYRTDREYEEHFRDVFAQAVRRRLRSDRPIVAELSGGVDSSSIVCVSDTLIAQGLAETPSLETLSYYDDSEPNWNERPYFTKLEEKRGRTGCHIDIAPHDGAFPEYLANCFASTPNSGLRRTNSALQFGECLTKHGSPVVLSGIGGDEVTGGVPSPIPEIEDLLASFRFRELAHRLKLWALNQRRPWFHLLWEAARGFLPFAIGEVPRYMRPAGWLRPEFVSRRRIALTGYPDRSKIFGGLPSFQGNVSTFSALQRQLGCASLASESLCEKRYPFLDRDLLEFAYAVPRDQMVRPGQRRSLMRRALAGIVPDDVLNRKRKAFVSRGPIAAISEQRAKLSLITRNMMLGSLGVVDEHVLTEYMERARRGAEIPIAPVMRTLALELWLRHSRAWNVIELTPFDQHESVTLAAFREHRTSHG